MPNNAEFLHQIIQTSRPRPSADRWFAEYLERELQSLHEQAAHNGSTWSTPGPPAHQVGARELWDRVFSTDDSTTIRGPY